MLAGADVRDGAAAYHVGDTVREQLAPHGEHAGRAWPADELVRAEEDGVLVGERVLRADRLHLDPHVRGRGGEIPEREGAVTVQQVGDRARVREDPRHVGGGGERSDLQRPRRMADELGLERREVDMAVRVLGDDDDVGDRLAPRQLVRVVLERPDEDDRALPGAGCERTARSGRRAPMAAAARGCRSACRRRRLRPSRRRSRTSPLRRRSPRARSPVRPPAAASSAARCRRTRCGCWRTAAAPRRGSRPRGTRGRARSPCSRRR